MAKSNLIEKLMNFHLSRQEATVYLCLIENGRHTGYEVSKLTGISRSNVYTALNLLADKGAAMLEEVGNTTYYAAVEPEEYMENRIKSLKRDKVYLIQHMGTVVQSQEGYLTIRGSQNIVDKALNMILSCRLRLYLASSGEIVEQLAPALTDAYHRGLKIVIISDKDCSDYSTEYFPDYLEGGQLRLITDSSYVLTGELTGKDTDTCLYSGQENLVNVMKEALRNKIRLLETKKDKGDGKND